MKALYVTTAGDEFGNTALKLLAELGEQTAVLKTDENAPEGSVAIFTTKPLLGEGRPRYLRCSSVKLRHQVPGWAITTSLWVGVLAVTDRKTRRARSTLASALATMVLMFNAWDWTSENPIPWADVEKDKSFQRGSKQWENVLAWRNGAVSSRLIQNGRRDFVTCKDIEARLKENSGYFVGDSSQALQISPDFFLISSEQVDTAQKSARVIWNFWRQALAAYLSAIEDVQLPKPARSWVAQSVEGTISDQQKEWQRRIASTQKVLPLFARADLSSLLSPEVRASLGKEMFLVEIQERIGGLGLVESWLRAIRHVAGYQGIIGDPEGFAPTFARAVKRATGKQGPLVVLICPEGYQAEQEFLAERLAVFGITAYIVMKDGLEKDLVYEGKRLLVRTLGGKKRGVDFLYRREMNAASLALSQIGRGIMEANLEGNLVVEPPLNMIFDCKTPMAWVHHRECTSLFGDDVRALIPPTALLSGRENETFMLADQELSLGQAIDKAYVIKYAGENIEYGFGGRAVYQTDTETVAYALEQIRAGHPWIIQPRDRTTYSARQWLRDSQTIQMRHGAGRVMFHCAFDLKTEIAQVVTACAQIRPNHWKAAGNRESIFQEIRVR